MTHHPRFLKAAVAVLGFLIVAALLLWWAFVQSSGRVVKFADGRELIIRQLTYGTNHEFVTGNALARFVAPVLPASMKARMAVQTLAQKTDTPTVIIWGEWRREGKGNSLAPMVRVKDNRPTPGTRMVAEWMSIRNGRYPAWQLKNFPRRDSTLQLEICQWDSSWHVKMVRELGLPNPAPGGFPRWKPEPYPIVRKIKGLEFSMLNLSAGEFIVDPWLGIMRHQQLATGYVATFKVGSDGQPQNNWKIERLLARDATGNTVASRLQSSTQVEEFLIFGLDELLWPSEQAWKFETTFTRNSGFRSNELCTMREIPIPISSTATQILTSVEANGEAFIGVELQRMRPPPSMRRMREDLEIEPLLPRRARKRVISLAEVKDDQGRFLIHDRSYLNLDGMHFGIELLPDSHWLDLTFAVQEPVVVEFVGGLSEPEPKRSVR